jgi:hypothetical protein
MIEEELDQPFGLLDQPCRLVVTLTERRGTECERTGTLPEKACQTGGFSVGQLLVCSRWYLPAEPIPSSSRWGP